MPTRDEKSQADADLKAFIADQIQVMLDMGIDSYTIQQALHSAIFVLQSCQPNNEVVRSE